MLECQGSSFVAPSFQKQIIQFEYVVRSLGLAISHVLTALGVVSKSESLSLSIEERQELLASIQGSLKEVQDALNKMAEIRDESEMGQ